MAGDDVKRIGPNMAVEVHRRRRLSVDLRIGPSRVMDMYEEARRAGVPPSDPPTVVCMSEEEARAFYAWLGETLKLGPVLSADEAEAASEMLRHLLRIDQAMETHLPAAAGKTLGAEARGAVELLITKLGG